MNVLYKVYKVIVGIVLPVLIISYEVYNWNESSWELKQMSVSVVICLVLLPENCLAFVSIYNNKTKYEVQVLALFLYISILNLGLHQPSTLLYTNSNLSGVKPLVIFFYAFLFINVFTYVVALFVLIIFTFYIIYNMFQANQAAFTNTDGLRPYELKRLIPVNVKNVLNDNESNSENVCSICQQGFNQNQQVILQMPICKHIYHKDCIHVWLDKSVLCPLCRSNIRKNIKKMIQQQNQSLSN